MATRTVEPDARRADADSPSALQSTKKNLNYLLYGSTAAAPASFKTRSLLRTVRYVGRYIFFRVIRYAKYAVVGAVVTALGGGILGTLTSGAAFFLAPSAFAGVGIGIGVGLVKFGWRHRPGFLRGVHLPFVSDSPASASAVNTAANGSADWEHKRSFWDWAADRAATGQSARADEQQDNQQVDAELAREKTEAQRARSNRGDVWMRA